MDTIPYHPLLEVTNEELKLVRKFYNIDDINKIKESLDAIEAWITKQDHLVEACRQLDRDVLERLFVLARGSVEGTKLKIDKLFTTRGIIPEINLNKKIEEFEELLDCLYVNCHLIKLASSRNEGTLIYVPLPKLNPNDHSRVMVTQLIKEKWEKFSLLSYLRYCFLIGEYRLYYDYSLADRFVIDLTNFNINILTRLNPIILKKGEIMCTECFGTKIKGIHLINAPPFVDKLVFILKQGLKEKVASRLHVHNSYEEFHKEIPKEILPKDFDGDGPSLSKLAEQWRDTLKSDNAKDKCERFNKFVTDESKRSEVKFNEEYLGMPGSFRKLAVD